MYRYTILGISPIDDSFKRINFSYRGKRDHIIVPRDASVFDSVDRHISKQRRENVNNDKSDI